MLHTVCTLFIYTGKAVTYGMISFTAIFEFQEACRTPGTRRPETTSRKGQSTQGLSNSTLNYSRLIKSHGMKISQESRLKSLGSLESRLKSNEYKFRPLKQF